MQRECGYTATLLTRFPGSPSRGNPFGQRNSSLLLRCRFTHGWRNFVTCHFLGECAFRRQTDSTVPVEAVGTRHFSFPSRSSFWRNAWWLFLDSRAAVLSGNCSLPTRENYRFRVLWSLCPPFQLPKGWIECLFFASRNFHSTIVLYFAIFPDPNPTHWQIRLF